MNLTVWTGIREYVAAEIQLAFARYDLVGMQMLSATADQQDRQRAKIAALEAQSTRMETAVRGALPKDEAAECAHCDRPAVDLGLCSAHARAAEAAVWTCSRGHVNAGGLECATCGSPYGSAESRASGVSRIQEKP